MKALFSFKGRSSRESWSYFTVLPCVAFAVMLGVVLSASHHVVEYVIVLALAIVAFVFGLAGTVRRLHDTDRSGWHVLIFLIPVIGYFWLLAVCNQRGTETTNKYGPIDP